MRLRNDLLPGDAPSELAVFQLTDEELPSSHIYMEAQIFTPDSKLFLLHRSAAPHGGSPKDPEHQYLLCAPDYKGALSPITTEMGATAPAISPDGRRCYYFVDETALNSGKLTLKQVDLDGSDRETILVVDKPLPGTERRPSRIYPISTISSDGKRIALPAFLGDGTPEGATWGLMVFDMSEATVNLVLEGPSWCNLHAQYCRSTDPEAARDISVQENHGNEHTPEGAVTRLTGGAGADIHLIRDDGTNMRSFPWGRDGNEFCQGHQCWRGTSTDAITSTSKRKPLMRELIESPPAPFAGHVGLATPGGKRNVLSREFDNPRFNHFATDCAGKRFISDAFTDDGRWLVYAARFGPNPGDPLVDWRLLLDTRSSRKAHPHPFVSPDGTKGFFNSDESGVLQAYMVVGF